MEDEIRVLFLINATSSTLIQKIGDKFPKYFVNGYYDIKSIKPHLFQNTTHVNYDNILYPEYVKSTEDFTLNFEVMKTFDIIVAGEHGNGFSNEEQNILGNLMVRILEETNTGIITTMWLNEMSSHFGFGGKWRSDKWNPIDSGFSSTPNVKGRKLKFVFDRIGTVFQYFPDINEYSYNVFRGGLNPKRPVRVIAEWEYPSHPQFGRKSLPLRKDTLKKTHYGIVELCKHKSLQLNFHPTMNSSEITMDKSLELMLKSVEYLYKRPLIVGKEFRKNVEEENDLKERMEFLMSDDILDELSIRYFRLKIGGECSGDFLILKLLCV